MQRLRSWKDVEDGVLRQHLLRGGTGRQHAKRMAPYGVTLPLFDHPRLGKV